MEQLYSNGHTKSPSPSACGHQQLLKTGSKDVACDPGYIWEISRWFTWQWCPITQQQPFYGSSARTTWLSRYQKNHSQPDNT